jgi:hypothetical protein
LNILENPAHPVYVPYYEKGFYAPPRSEVNIAGVAFDKTSDSGAPGSDAALQPVLQILQ